MIELMFAPEVLRLAEAVDGLEAPVTCEDLAVVLALADRLTALASTGIGEVDAAELWDTQDAVSMTAWLRGPLRATHGQAARPLSRARRLRALPATRAAWESGRISTAQVEAILARLNPARLAVFAACETDMVGHLVDMDGPATVGFMAAWADAVDALVDPDPAGLNDNDDGVSELYVSPTLGGRSEVSGSFDAELGVIVRAALGAATTADGAHDRTRSAAQRRADALGDICRFFLDHHEHPNPTPRNRPHVGVVIDWDTVAGGAGCGTVVETGQTLRAEWVRQVLCDAAVFRSCAPARRPSWTWVVRHRLCHRPSTPPWRCETAGAAGPAVTAHPRGATPTTSSTGPTAGPPPWETLPCCAGDITPASTAATYTPTSTWTPPP
jgi:hypothetical protein